MLSVRHLVFPSTWLDDSDWKKTSLEGEGAMGQTGEVKVHYFVDYASGKPHTAGYVAGRSHSARCSLVRDSWDGQQISLRPLKFSTKRQDDFGVPQLSSSLRSKAIARQWCSVNLRNH